MSGQGLGSDAVSVATEGGGPAADAAPARRPDPVIRKIGFNDLGEALGAGLRDFQAAPLFGFFFGGIYALGGMAITWSAWAGGLLYLVYPLAAGFALIGPFVAVGLYEVSRIREQGRRPGWGEVMRVVFAQSGREFGWMAFVTIFMFMMWMYQVRLLLALFFGFRSFSPEEFLSTVLTTPEGLLFLAIGHLDGAVLSLILFSLTVVSFPLLLDREVDFITAMITSVRSVIANPGPMVAWAAAVVLLLIAASLPLFAGLFVVLPILGHTTWHLYRRLVAPVPADGPA
ncbi:DUF2189 domain-containing protein [Alsobacter sp. SYSU M60028]|uniref:DUF2189 domain-containing protein n=1 Tax=Alsobacter ponti TaxID=2962936 RepID=A0ABT1LFM9_9HYPH|nr:DUF2189 domain-containing protein [Alsobacter ponti]MCP8940300.1 DUF2189 domain-containing protein [Alsobacter ponti]